MGRVFAKYQKTCPACAEIEAKENAERVRQAAAIKLTGSHDTDWAAICPAIFRDTELAKLPCPSALQDLVKWKYGPTGLVLHGASGKGKSRCAWLLLETQFKAGKKFKVLDSMAGLKYASKFSESAAKVESWIEDLIATDILFMDDVFKNKLTDSFEGVIFTLLDQRIQRALPTILTSNDTGKTLAGRMTEDRAEPLVRRMREHSQMIHFK